MAQTKRKRRTKHRGNAAGVVEARGRTGRRPTPQEQRRATRESARDRRLSKEPTWRSAFVKSLVMAGLLFAFTQFGLFGSTATIGQSLVICLFALAFYTPLAYATDRWVYQRAQRRKQAQQPKG